VHCLSNTTDLALGFVGAHSLSERRIFIRRSELPTTWRVSSGYEACLPPDTVYIDRPSPPPPIPAAVLAGAFGAGSGYLPIEAVYSRGGTLVGYTAKARDCIDCRTRGASVRPSFW
jgi:hypothetical protein